VPALPGVAAFAADALERMLAAHPVEATYLGDHRGDGRLDDPSPEAGDQRAAELHDELRLLDGLPPSGVEEEVDAEILRTALRAELLGLEALREAEWNPMQHNPGPGIHALVSREFAPLQQRLALVVQRVAAIPPYLQAARRRLGDLSAVHATAALDQLQGTDRLLSETVPQLAAPFGDLTARLEPAIAAARSALLAYRGELADRAEHAGRTPRLGPELFSRKLALVLDTEVRSDDLLARAEADLEETSEAIVAEAGRLARTARPDSGTVRAVLDDLAREAPNDATVLELCRTALGDATAFVRDRGLVTVFDDPVHVVEMPEIDRGVASAYCRPPGPLETEPPPTEVAVSPTPGTWDEATVRSFYREYNRHMLQNLMVHEAMPGHALQLMHANRYPARTPVRAVWWSGTFVEGWAVYAEELMARHGYRADESPRDAAALRMQQLKMRLRTILNAVLDVRFHCDGLSELEAMHLMTTRGYQEIGEATGKWRRVQLTAAQLSTYYVGFGEVRELVDDVRAARPGASEREAHDAVLAHGAPPARHLRRLLLARPA
jgi:hypothetical protein